MTENNEIVWITDEDDLERLVMSRSQGLHRLLQESREQIAKGETLTIDEVFAHLKS
jgi:hypothetical protein